MIQSSDSNESYTEIMYFGVGASSYIYIYILQLFFLGHWSLFSCFFFCVFPSSSTWLVCFGGCQPSWDTPFHTMMLFVSLFSSLSGGLAVNGFCLLPSGILLMSAFFALLMFIGIFAVSGFWLPYFFLSFFSHLVSV